jgi:hypothetical protein
MASREEYQTLLATLDNLRDIIISQVRKNDDELAAYLSNELDAPFDKVIGSIEGYRDRPGPMRLCPTNKSRVTSKPSQQNPKDLSKGDKAIIVLNYGPNAKSHALFGDFRTKYVKFKDEFLNPTSWIKYNRNLAIGPGWTLMERDRLGELKKSLKKFNIPWQEIEYKALSQNPSDEKDSSDEDPPSEPKKSKNKSKKKERVIDIEEDPPSDPKKSKKKSKKKEELPESDSDEDPPSEPKKSKSKKKSKKKERVVDSDSEEDPPSEPKKSKKDKSVIGEKLTTNQYGNLQEKKFGIIFAKLPVGKKNRMVNVAIGNQDTDTKPSKKYKGLKTVKCLTDDQIEECEDRAWTVLSEDMVVELEENEEYEELAAELRAILQTGDVSESSDDSDSDSDSDSDDSDLESE